MILWAWTALLSGVALLPTYTNRGNAMVPFLLAALALVLYILFHPGVRSARGQAGRTRHPRGLRRPGDDVDRGRPRGRRGHRHRRRPGAAPGEARVECSTAKAPPPQRARA